MRHLQRRPFYLLLFLINCCLAMNTFAQENDYREKRMEMVATQLEGRRIEDPRVLDAFRKVERHRFTLERHRHLAYEDQPLPIGEGQTISQPYIVAFMTELADITPEEKVLEVGTGSGYQAAILGELAKRVYTIEIVRPLGERARKLLNVLGYDNVHVRIGDGYAGWPEAAPFDAILVAAAAPEVPPPLVEQLADGGRLVIPIGDPDRLQYLTLLRKVNGQLRRERVVPVRFVPFTRD